MKEIFVKSDGTLADLCEKVVTKLQAHEASLELAYQFSFSRDKNFRDLIDKENWINLVAEVREHRKKPTTKRNGGSDAWFVCLRDVQEMIVENAPTAKASLALILKNTHHRIVPCSITTAISNAKDDLDTPSISINSLLLCLTRESGCSAHGGSLCLFPDADVGPLMKKYGLPVGHVCLTDAERREWAASLMAHTSTMDHPNRETMDKICLCAAGSSALKSRLQDSGSSRNGPRGIPETPS
ncbi:hypothetical protein CPB86DRAFT_717101 [Serendipita vermifera]|nr:hypothetical protein CPB86DRAFT_717101 [Serendipita vermifera]